MSYMAHGDHIAITTGDKSTTRRKVSVWGCPVAPLIAVTLCDSSDTYSRNVADSEILVPGTILVATECRLGHNAPKALSSAYLRGRPPKAPQDQLASSIAWSARHRAVTRWYMATASSTSPFASPLTAAPISATDWSARSASSSNRCTRPP